MTMKKLICNKVFGENVEEFLLLLLERLGAYSMPCVMSCSEGTLAKLQSLGNIVWGIKDKQHTYPFKYI